MYLLEQLLLAIYFHFLAIYIHTNVDLSPLQSRYMWILTSLIGKHLKVGIQIDLTLKGGRTGG